MAPASRLAWRRCVATTTTTLRRPAPLPSPRLLRPPSLSLTAPLSTSSARALPPAPGRGRDAVAAHDRRQDYDPDEFDEDFDDEEYDEAFKARVRARGPAALPRLRRAVRAETTAEGLRLLDRVAAMSGHGDLDAQMDADLGFRRDKSEDGVGGGGGGGGGGSGGGGDKREVREWEERDKLLENHVLRYDKFHNKDRNPRSLWYDEDDPNMVTQDEEVFDEDDMLDMAHSKLDVVRDLRHYTRLAVWEMPLLSKLAKPFQLPKDDHVLRWRYTTYMGESHQAESKVVVQFSPPDLGLTPSQTATLRHLVGPRLDPVRDLVRMSSDRHEHQAQNRLRLLRLVNDLVAAARRSSDPDGGGGDSFADVPLDTRHYFHAGRVAHSRRHKRSTAARQARYPPAWHLTDERRAHLDERRVREAQQDAARRERGAVVHGQRLIDDHLLNARLAQEEAAAAAAQNARGGGLRGR